MKTLKESILGNTGLDEKTVFHVEECKKWINQYFKTKYLKLKVIDDQLIVSAREVRPRGWILSPSYLPSLTNGLFVWGKVQIFDCSKTTIPSLEGAPQECEEFICSECPKLTSLKGVPQKCEKFDCKYCENLLSLEYAPKKCSNFFNCQNCYKLTNLEGAPKKCESFCCGCNYLISLKGAPQECKKFNCWSCDNLTSLEYAPKECDEFRCSDCKNLESMKGCPRKAIVINCNDCPNLKDFNYFSPKYGKIDIYSIYCKGVTRNREEKSNIMKQLGEYGIKKVYFMYETT